MIPLRRRKGGQGTARPQTWECHRDSYGQEGSIARRHELAKDDGGEACHLCVPALEVEEEERGSHGDVVDVAGRGG